MLLTGDQSTQLYKAPTRAKQLNQAGNVDLSIHLSKMIVCEKPPSKKIQKDLVQPKPREKMPQAATLRP